MSLDVANFLASTLFNKISSASKRNPNDSKTLALFKRTAQNAEDRLKWELRKELLIASIAAFTRSIESIQDRMPSRPIQQCEPCKMFERAQNMLAPKSITKLAIILFDRDERRAADLIENFKTAQKGFMECWRDKENVHFYYRFAALRMAFFCDVYRILLIDKNLENLKIEEYFAFVLPKLSRCIRQRNACLSNLIGCIREQHEYNFNYVCRFVLDLLRFTDGKLWTKYALVRKASEVLAFDQQDKKLTSSDISTVVSWLKKCSAGRDDSLSLSLAFTRKRTEMAVSIIREIYRTRFEKYDPFHFDSKGYKFAMESWIPISARRVYGTVKDEDPFQLIEEQLKESCLAVIAGVPGVGKTLLTQKIAFDFATAKNGDNRWDKYEFVLLAEFRSTSDRKHETIIDLAMHGMEKIGVNKNLCEFVKENVQRLCDPIKEKVQKRKVLIVLDGYDESIDNQCPQLNNVLNSHRSELPFQLIVTGRPTGVLKRKEIELRVIKVIGFGEKQIRKYIGKHFEIGATVTENEIREYIENQFNYDAAATDSIVSQIVKDKVDSIISQVEKDKIESIIAQIVRNKVDSSISKIVDDRVDSIISQVEKDKIESIIAQIVKDKVDSITLQIKKANLDAIISQMEKDKVDSIIVQIKEKKVDSLISQIKENKVFEKMARTPLMLAFMCLVYTLQEKTRLERLYENVVVWLIKQKLHIFPNLLAELASGEGVFFGSKEYDMTAEDTKAIAENWIGLEQMKRLGYISLSLLADKKYQFDHNLLQGVQPNVNINVFKKIGLIITNTEGSAGSADGSLCNQTVKYQFAHRTLQEYFAAMFMTKWQNEYRKKEKDSMPKIYHYEEVPQFFVDILLKQRDKQLKASAQQYLMNAKSICFNIKSNDRDEGLRQLKYINNILDACLNISRVHINLNKMFIAETIEIRFLSKTIDIQLIVSDGIFNDNQLNMISIAAGDHNLFNIKFNRCQFSCSRLIAFAAYINANAQQFQRADPKQTNFKSHLKWISRRLLNFITFNSADRFESTKPIKNRFKLSTQKRNKKSRKRRRIAELKSQIGYETRTDELVDHTMTKQKSVNQYPNKLALTSQIRNEPSSEKNRKTDNVARKRQKKAGLKFHIDGETIKDREHINQFDNFHQQYVGRLEIRSLTALNLTAPAIFSILQSFSCIKSLDLRLPDPKNYDKRVEKSIEMSMKNLSDLPNLCDIKLSMRKSFENKISIGKTNWNYLNKILQKCPKIHSLHIWLHCNTIDEPIDLQFSPSEPSKIIDIEIHDGIFEKNESNMIHISGAQRVDLAFYRRKYPYQRLNAFAKFVSQNVQLFERIQFFNLDDNGSMLRLVENPLHNIAFKHKSKNKKGNEYYTAFYMEPIIS